jgi:hypothetical protein
MTLALEDRRISQDYFKWLCGLVFTAEQIDSEDGYNFLADRMFRVTFNDNVPNDRNRSADGVKLRHDFLREYSDNYTAMEASDLLFPSANVLEVLVALANLANYEWDLSPQEWFARFLQNLKLTCFVDREIQNGDINRIGTILAKFNDRRYSQNGHGGVFPLRKRGWPDQREEELWYQLAHYIEENR